MTPEALRERADELTAQGYRQAVVQDKARAQELVDLYREIGYDVEVLEGAVPGDPGQCQSCLEEPGLVTLFIRESNPDG
jgi:hypothetical protein